MLQLSYVSKSSYFSHVKVLKVSLKLCLHCHRECDATVDLKFKNFTLLLHFKLLFILHKLRYGPLILLRNGENSIIWAISYYLDILLVWKRRKTSKHLPIFFHTYFLFTKTITYIKQKTIAYIKQKKNKKIKYLLIVVAPFNLF